MIEKTAMSKTYKLPTFLAFIDDNQLLLKIDDERLYESFHEFYLMDQMPSIYYVIKAQRI